MILKIRYIVFILFIVGFSGKAYAGNDNHSSEEIDINSIIFSHIADSHNWHLWDVTDDDGEKHAVSIPLPVLLVSTQPFSFDVFMSGEFHHGEHPVTKGEHTFVLHNNTIYYAENEQGDLSYDEQGNITSASPIDISITKNVFTMLLVSLIMIWVFSACAKSYTKRVGLAPKGLQGFMEPIILFVRDEIAIPNIGHKKYKTFLPYLLTAFFFIWFLNLMGLVPFFPGSANVTGNIATTAVLAVFTLVITNVYANKDYWRHIFAMPGLPAWLLPIMIIVEIISIFTKPFALAVRLFANITAGHIIVLSLVSLIFIFQSLSVAPVSFIFVLFMDVLELFVATLQAFIFTMLSALFIGMAVVEEH
ncbi:MAG: F0F1 ATP synthase subunit A [Bacteroidales bacterium]